MCSIDHTNPDNLPAFLCRLCNPSAYDMRRKLNLAIGQIERQLRGNLPAPERERLGKELQALQLEELVL